MPFTLSHAAAVLPAIRRDGTGARGPLIASALVAGSFAPDMTYFADTVLPGAMLFGDFTHSPAGVLTVDALVTAVLIAGWLLLREPLLALLPPSWQGRAWALVRGRSSRGEGVAPLLLRFWVSAVLGAATHIVWDAFTHLDRWGMRLLPALGEVVAGLPLYTYAQYGGSALALLVIGAFLVTAVRGLPRETPAPAAVPGLTGRERLLAAALLALALLAGVVHRCLRSYETIMTLTADPSPLDFVPTAMFGAGAGLVLGLPVYAAAVRIRGRAEQPGTG
ncbi:DUF4184 family protein [Streptomyces sp. NPDC051776]|uniref:DUF4184 family protein n=1 Tax=Streptomyces sp. NPDC051776 TaxID=3155414 RepID=UPI00343D7EA0